MLRKYNECDFTLTPEHYEQWRQSVEVYVEALIGRKPDAVDMSFAAMFFQQATMHFIELKEQEMVEVRFTPQAWQNDYAVEVDPEGECTFLVSSMDTLGMSDDSYESDELKNHPNAPEWIKNWRGPFYFQLG